MPAVITKDGSQDFIESLSSNLSCIKNTIDARQYNIYSTSLEEIINADSRLASSAVNLWFLLRNMANEKNNFSITISNAELGKKIRRSPWTICRLLNQLQTCGYLYRESNSGKTNKIHIKLSEELVRKIDILNLPTPGYSK